MPKMYRVALSDEQRAELNERARARILAPRLRVLLRQHDFRWKRTKRSVRHQRKDPDLQASKEADLELLHFGRALPPTG